jgi:hypothetical protein
MAMGWAARYRKLTPYQQAIVRSGVDSVLFKAEFQTPPTPHSHVPFNDLTNSQYPTHPNPPMLNSSSAYSHLIPQTRDKNYNPTYQNL